MTIQGKDDKKSRWIPGCFLLDKTEKEEIKETILNSFIEKAFKIKKDDNLFKNYKTTHKKLVNDKEPVKYFSSLNRLDKRYQSYQII